MAQFQNRELRSFLHKAALFAVRSLQSWPRRVRLAILVAFPSYRRLDRYVRRYARASLRSEHQFLFRIAIRCLGILNWKNSVESGELPFLEGFLPPYDSDQWVAIDVGANTGQFASWVLASTRRLHLISYEANPLAWKRYADNLSSAFAGSGMRRWRLVEKGVSSAAGKAAIYDYTDEPGSSHASLYKETFESIHHRDAASIEVELCTLDANLADLGRKICLLKFDIEGHELEALKGASATIARHRPPLILIEFNAMNAMSNASFHAIRKAIGEDYLPHRLLPGGELLPLAGEAPLMTEIYAYQNIAFIRSP
ncbi:MAG: FkbM family methyltransferase [Burkholderiales bacterium]